MYIENCEKCNGKNWYSERYDCDYCIDCDEWDRAQCVGECYHCKGRPERPSLMVGSYDEEMSDLYLIYGIYHDYGDGWEDLPEKIKENIKELEKGVFRRIRRKTGEE